MTIPYTFAGATTAIPLAQLDANFASPITLGNVAMTLSNTYTSIGNLTLTNVTVSSGNVAVTNANVTTLTATNDASISGLTVGKGGGAVSSNTAVGANALITNSSGAYSTAIGYLALTANTSGSVNDAFGYGTLGSNTTGSNNASFGAGSLNLNTTGGSNTAIGRLALTSNTTASNNTAVGYQAGYTATTAAGGTYLGYQAGYVVTTGGYNTMVGYQAGVSQTTGSLNTYLGYGSGLYMTTGTKNTIIGGYTGANGGLDIRTSNNYIVLSDGDGNPRGIFDTNGTFLVGTTSPYATEKVSLYSNSSSNSTTLHVRNMAGSTYSAIRSEIAGAGNNTSTWHFTGVTSGINAWYLYGNGTTSYSSDERLKKNIETARSGYLDDLAKLRVVKYNWLQDEEATPKELGLIAQEVEQVFPNLIQEHELEGVGIRKNIKHSVMEFILIKAIQELKAEVDSLKQQLGK